MAHFKTSFASLPNPRYCLHFAWFFSSSLLPLLHFNLFIYLLYLGYAFAAIPCIPLPSAAQSCLLVMCCGRGQIVSKSIARSFSRRQSLYRGNIPVLNSALGNPRLETFTSRRRATSNRQGHVAVPTRSLSTSKARRYASVEESLDIREQDRESDQVDVCIVGGGNRPSCSSTIFG